MNKKQKIWLAVLGSVVGLVNGFFGGGGGMLVVPMLMIITKMAPKQSHATAILIILPITVISVVVYLFGGAIKTEPLNVALTTLGVVAGGVIGAFALKKVSNSLLVKAFAVVMVIAGVKMLFF